MGHVAAEPPLSRERIVDPLRAVGERRRQRVDLGDARRLDSCDRAATIADPSRGGGQLFTGCERRPATLRAINHASANAASAKIAITNHATRERWLVSRSDSVSRSTPTTCSLESSEIGVARTISRPVSEACTPASALRTE